MSLTRVYLALTGVVDVEPLSHLSALKKLGLEDNRITDNSPLLENDGLGHGGLVVPQGEPAAADREPASRGCDRQGALPWCSRTTMPTSLPRSATKRLGHPRRVCVTSSMCGEIHRASCSNRMSAETRPVPKGAGSGHSIPQ